MAEVTMPRLSDTMEEGTIGHWLKKPGDEVKKGDVLAEIETDKATMELEAYEGGTLQEILVQEGQAAAIGAVIAVIGAAGSAPATSAPQKSAPAASPTPAAGNGKEQQTASVATAVGTAPAAPTTQSGERVKASPLARSIAEQHGIDLRQVEGTGPGGRIIKANVEAFQQQQEPAPKPQPAATAPAAPAPAPEAPAPPVDGPAPVPLNRMRRAIAQTMTRSKQTIPHLYVTNQIEMDALLDMRRDIRDSNAASVKISVNDMVVKAVAKALEAHPLLNSSYVVGGDGQASIVTHEHINVNVAVSVDAGLIVPVVADANQKSLGTIAADIKDLAVHAREGTIKQHQLEGGTFTVSNLGMFDVVDFGAIITPPQAAVLAVSSIQEMPIVRYGEVVVAHMMNATVSVDHRVTDGAEAARFMQTLKRLLEIPLSLLV